MLFIYLAKRSTACAVFAQAARDAGIDYNAMAKVSNETKENQKLCFVTIGATANFNGLVEACLALDFLEALQQTGYTHLLIQYGKGYKEKFIMRRNELDQNHLITLKISGYDFKTPGTLYDMRAAKGHWGGLEGAVISHAGLCCRQK